MILLEHDMGKLNFGIVVSVLFCVHAFSDYVIRVSDRKARLARHLNALRYTFFGELGKRRSLHYLVVLNGFNESFHIGTTVDVAEVSDADVLLQGS